MKICNISKRIISSEATIPGKMRTEIVQNEKTPYGPLVFQMGKEVYVVVNMNEEGQYKDRPRAHGVELRARTIFLRKQDSNLLKELMTPSGLIQSFCEAVTTICPRISSYF